MVQSLLNSDPKGNRSRKRVRLWCGIGVLILFSGGFACFWGGLIDPENRRDTIAANTQTEESPLINLLPDASSEKKPSEKKPSEKKPSEKKPSEKSGSAKERSVQGSAVLQKSGSAGSDDAAKRDSSARNLPPVPQYNIYPGRVFALKKSILTFRVPGPLLKISVVPGQTVKKGEILMQIDPRDYQIQVDLAQSRLDAARANLEAMRKGARPEDVALLQAKVEEAEASYTLASKEYERAKALVEGNTISASEFDTANRACILAGLAWNSAKKELEKGLAGARIEDIHAAEAEIRGLEASLSAAKNSLADTTLRAPYDGVITTKMIEEHEMVTTTPTYRTVLGIHDISRLKIEIYIPEREMIRGRIQAGQTAEVRFTAKRTNCYKAKLAEIDTEPSEVGMTYKLTFVLDRPTDLPILPGMISEVSLPDPTAKKR